jgi:single-stranded DNA-binding protein
MEDFNKIIVLGTVTTEKVDIFVEKTKNGLSVCNFGLQIKQMYGEKEEVVNLLIKTFGTQAEACSRALTLDSRVMVEGRLKVEERNEISSYHIVAISVTFLDFKN